MIGKPDESFYDNCWPAWEKLKPVGPNAKHTRRILFKLVQRLNFTTVLDVGCGDGLLMEELLIRHPDVTIEGCEFSNLALEKARSRLPSSKFTYLDLSKNSIPKQFDLILCVDVLEHIMDDLAALANLRQMTSHYLLIAVPLGPLFEHERTLIGHVHGYTRTEFEAKLHKSGFRIIRSLQWGFPFYDLIRRLTQEKSPAISESVNRKLKNLFYSLLYYVYFLNFYGIGERYFCIVTPAQEIGDKNGK